MAFVIADDGKWAVIQQGMNGDRGQARRYHWLSEGLTGFLDSPHAAVDGAGQGRIVNLADRRAQQSRAAQLALLAEGPDRILRAAAICRNSARRTPRNPCFPPVDAGA